MIVIYNNRVRVIRDNSPNRADSLIYFINEGTIYSWALTSIEGCYPYMYASQETYYDD